jgi:hypothetical protein
MLWRLVLLVLFAMFLAWYKPTPNQVSITPPAREPVPPVLSEHQIHEQTEQCDKKSRDEFDRSSKEGAAEAQFSSHYNVKRDTCFYLLTVNRSDTLSKKLYDVGTRELYGEYLGPAGAEPSPDGQPKTCRVESLFCASEREWDVLVTPYLQN